MKVPSTINTVYQRS